MSKKTFTAAPRPKQPSNDEIAAFERGGAGHDTRATASTPAEPTKRLSLDLPESVHRRYKTACSATNTKMVADILAFIERRTAELEREAGIHHN